MKEEFEEGELVEVRDDDDQEWVKAVFVQKVVDVSYWARMPDSPAAGYQQIRKFQPETEQPEIIEERFEKIEAILNGAIASFNEQIASLKKQIK